LSDVLSKAEKMAYRDVPVLLLGETGTGKELFAQAIHEASPRSQNPFVAVNCGALPRELAESLLFGHKKGAFTGAYQNHSGYFAQADGPISG
jgi:transcriptional regulator with GAF, ATPase, and Fis domain